MKYGSNSFIDMKRFLRLDGNETVSDRKTIELMDQEMWVSSAMSSPIYILFFSVWKTHC